MVSGEHGQLEKVSSTAPMLGDEKMLPHVILAPSAGMGKILIREDTILGSIPCAGCGRSSLRCGASRQIKSLCWGQISDRKYACMLATLTATFLASLVGTVFFCFTNFLNNAIISNMVLANNSMAFEMWEKPTIEPIMKIHLFNYTNIQQAKEGSEKLRVQDVGPFTYSQSVERVNVVFNGDGTLTYQEKASFTFQPHLSEGNRQFDQVFVPDLPLLSAVTRATNSLDGLMQIMFANTLRTMLENQGRPFVKLAAHRFLWGYDDQIIRYAKPFLTLVGEMPFEKFGLLVTKNGTMREEYTINTGELNIDRLNFIEKIDGKRSLYHWGTPECNSFDATDGSIFPASLLDRRQTLYVYKDTLCRRLPFVYQKDVEVLDGILAYRYVIPPDVFDDPDHNPANQCYCDMDSGSCPPRGVANVSSCAFGTPIMASFPHFYLAEKKLFDEIDGLHPDPEKHSSFADIHPTLGIPLNVRSGFQVNVQVPKSKDAFTELGFLKAGTILPIAWIETSMGTIPQDIRTLVYHGTYSTAAAQLALSWGCGALLLVSTLLLVLLVRSRRNRPCATVKIDASTLNSL